MNISSKVALTIASVVLTATVGGSAASAGPPLKSWVNEGNPYFFENCWWQKQRLQVLGRPSPTVRNKKISCPDLNNYRAGDIRRPSPFPNSGRSGVVKR